MYQIEKSLAPILLIAEIMHAFMAKLITEEEIILVRNIGIYRFFVSQDHVVQIGHPR
jgi:hypothetical protein